MWRQNVIEDANGWNDLTVGVVAGTKDISNHFDLDMDMTVASLPPWRGCIAAKVIIPDFEGT